MNLAGSESAAHYRREGLGLTELAPACCPVGHPLGPGQVLVGALPCLCAGRPHRTWQCVACDRVLVWPGCEFRPQWHTWGGTDQAMRR